MKVLSASEQSLAKIVLVALVLCFSACSSDSMNNDDDDYENAYEGLIEYIKASNPDSGDSFGYAVALSDDGNTLAVSAPFEDSNAAGPKNPEDPDYYSSQDDDSARDSGAVYVFQRSGGEWNQQAYIKSPDPGSGDNFGTALSMSADGNFLVVGAPYEDSDGSGDPEDNSLANSGAAYVFSRNGDAWSFDAYLKASNPDIGDHFGCSLALSADGITLAVGASLEDSGDKSDPEDNSEEDSGAVYTFEWDVSSWIQTGYVKALLIDEGDQFGYAVSISEYGDYLLAGIPYEDIDTTETDQDDGAAYVFKSTHTGWTAQALLHIDYNVSSNMIGSAVALSGAGDTAVLGGAQESGRAYVFYDMGVSWEESSNHLNAPGVLSEDMFGSALAFSGNAYLFASGAPGESSTATGIDEEESDDDVDASSSGAVFLFKDKGVLDFELESKVKASNTEKDDLFGSSVAFDNTGSTLAVGAPGEDSGASGIGGNQDSNSASESGAVYIYNLDLFD